MTTNAIERAHQQVVDDRKRIDETASELREVLHQHVDEAKTAVDPRTYIREYPWIALGLVFGAGVAIAMTGADRAAAHGVVDASRSAGSALGEKAVDAKDFVVDKVKGDEPDPLIYADGGAESPIDRRAGIADRLMGKVDDLLYNALEPVLADMRRTVTNTPSRDNTTLTATPAPDRSLPAPA